MLFISGYCQIRNRNIKTHDGDMACLDVDDFNAGLYKQLAVDYPKFYKMDAQSSLGFLAAEILLKSLGIGTYPSESVGTVLSNRHASLDADMKYEQSVKTAASPSLFVYTLPNIVPGEICIRHRIKGENAFFVTPAFDAEFMCEYVDLMFTQTHMQACIAGWIDVLQDQHDVLLYLVEKEKRGVGMEHTASQLRKLYES
jgi:hypothetical protein